MKNTVLFVNFFVGGGGSVVEERNSLRAPFSEVRSKIDRDRDLKSRFKA